MTLASQALDRCAPMCHREGMGNSNGPITSAEAGVIVGKSARTVQRLAADGELSYIRKLPGPNGDYLFDRAVVESYARDLAKAAS
jgi:hypothetical protein